MINFRFSPCVLCLTGFSPQHSSPIAQTRDQRTGAPYRHTVHLVVKIMVYKIYPTGKLRVQSFVPCTGSFSCRLFPGKMLVRGDKRDACERDNTLLMKKTLSTPTSGSAAPPPNDSKLGRREALHAELGVRGLNRRKSQN